MRQWLGQTLGKISLSYVLTGLGAAAVALLAAWFVWGTQSAVVRRRTPSRPA